MPDEVTTEVEYLVGSIFYPTETTGLEVAEQGGTLEVDERTDEQVPAGRDAGESGQAGAAAEVEEHRLKVIACGVAERNAAAVPAAGNPEHVLVAQGAAGFFNPEPVPPGVEPDARPNHDQFQLHALKQRLDEPLVPSGLGPEPVVQVETDERKTEPFLNKAQQVEQAD
jgi:hypothetical protein